MSMTASDSTVAREAWSNYWQTGSTEQALPDDHAGTQALAAFWDRYAAELDRRSGGKLLDLACGGGFVSRRLLAALDAPARSWRLLALDLAEPAVRQLSHASAGKSQGVVADAARLPFADGSIDAVVSQFGLEYAGLDALIGASVLLAPDGELTLLVHHADGSIAQSCRNNALVISRAREAGLLQAMMRLFTLLGQSGASQSALNEAVQALQDAVSATESLLKTGPACAAMPWIQRLYQDVRQLYERAAAYEPAEALQWLHSMEGQLRSYGERMQGMVTAALSAAHIDALTQAWQQQGLAIRQAEALRVDDRALAWQLRAARSAA